ncbi:DoxX-like protein [Aminobacter sp. AP02]|nr:DoxX-like protein [Aminobacter sp. AP02]
MGRTVAILIARLIFAGVFAMAATFKFAGMDQTAGYIAAAGFPFPLFWPGSRPSSRPRWCWPS